MSTLNNISKKAKIGHNVQIGDFTTIHDNVEIGDNSIIESNCIIGYPCKSANGKPLIIGKNSHIRSHSIFYEGSSYGQGLITGHHAFARENCVVGKYLQLGTNAVLDGYSKIGDYVRLHSLVTIAEDVVIGDFAYLFPRVQTLNDPFPPSPIVQGVKISDLAVVASASILYPGVSIGYGCFIAGGSHVKLNIPDGQCAAGIPAVVFAPINKYIHPKFGAFHPWIKKIINKYPEESHKLIEEKIEKLNQIIENTSKSK